MLGHLMREAALQELLHAGEASRAQDDQGGVDLLRHRDDAVPGRSVDARPGLGLEADLPGMLRADRVPRLTEDEQAVDALADLSAPSANRGLVVDNGHLVGLLSITDLARALEVGRRQTKQMAPRGV